MYYISTRNPDIKVTPSEAVIKGIAEDGGLFIPNKIPEIEDLNQLVGMDYKQLASYILKMFFTDFSDSEINECVNKAYTNNFRSSEVAPLKKCFDMSFIELFHGPTLAFKDMALSILPHLMTMSAKKNNLNKKIVILTATSGDTGKAALEGFKDVEPIQIIVFFPRDGVSEVQKLQMLTQEGNNTQVVMINGNFDDAQSGVKELFTDAKLKEELLKENIVLSSANSINIGRLVPQIVYYVYSYMKMVEKEEVVMGEKINIGVPTGNFGNILAGYYAKKMGLPVDKLICASNKNNVLTEFFKTGKYDIQRDFHTTSSPSMDILISSNLERLLYEITRDCEQVGKYMKSLKDQKNYEITQNQYDALADFYAGFADEKDVKKAIKKAYDDFGYVIDTHSAVAYHVCLKYRQETNDDKKIIIASTASPFKFAGSVYSSLGDNELESSEFKTIDKLAMNYRMDIPKPLEGLAEKEILHDIKCEKNEIKNTVQKILGM